MKILVACEYSGRVREAFRYLGHDAWSCDLLPAEDGSPYHYQCDVRDVLGMGWDMLIAFPDCTYLTCSAEWAYTDGPYHQKVKPGTLVGAARRAAREQALEFVAELLSAPIPRKCLENPRGVIGTRIRPASQYIQPYDFGENASKATGLWLENLPLLVSTKRVNGRFVECGGKVVERWENQTDSGQNRLSPSANRWKDRARTYPGIAAAMAEQWDYK